MEFSFSSMIAALKPSEIRELAKMAASKDIVSFGGGMPDPETFAVGALKEIIDDIISKESAIAFQYGITSGMNPLRSEICRLVKETENFDCKEEEVNVTSGSQQALYAVGKTLVSPGEEIITEGPTYLGAISAFNANLIRMHTVEMDENGMDVDKLETFLYELKKQGKKPKFIYAIPNFQNPAGFTLSLERRKHLIDLAVDYNVPVVEDNPYGELIYSGSKLPSLKSLDPDERVIYMGTFSKVMTPGLRIGYVIGRKDFIAKINLLKQALDLSTNTLAEHIAYEYLKRNIMKIQVPKTIEIYRKKRDAMLSALSKYFPKDATWSKPDGGMFVWATVNPKVNTTDMRERSIKNGVAYISGASFYPNRDKFNNMRLNFSFPKIDNITEGIRRLASTIEEETERTQKVHA